MLTKSERIKKFWDKVEMIPFHSCWEWSGYIHPHGYGGFNFGNRMGYAHRFSWIIHFGDIPHGYLVLHKCDNRSCVRPSHLFLGTQKDNMDDKVKKNRQNKGESHWNHKLTTHQVLEIRKFTDAKIMSHEKIAKIFNIRREQVSRIYRRQRWNSI